MAAGFSKFRPSFRRSATDDVVETSPPVDNVAGDSKAPATVTNAEPISPQENEARDVLEEAQAKLPAQDVQRGVQNVAAVTLIWSQKSLVAVFILCVVLHT